MADFTALKTAIQNAIKQNGNEEITGNLLQEVLLAIVTTLGDGSINDLVTALGSEATTRSQADSTLQQNIDAEATTRGNADTTLQQNIDAEAQARSQAVSAEAQARSQADTALGGRIDGVVSSITAINNAIENGYVYAGIATPSSTPTTGKVFYLALTAGTYTNFGNIAVTQGINILKYNGSTWSLESFVGIDDAPAPSSQKLVKSGGVFDEVMKNGSAFDLSAYNGGATYADLNAALTALNALPAAYKRGGMSMKFVLSSDNKYVQYRLIADAWSTTVSDWIEEIDANICKPCIYAGFINVDIINKKLQFVNYGPSTNSVYCQTKSGLVVIELSDANDTIDISNVTGFLKCLVVNSNNNGFEIIPYGSNAGRCVIATLVFDGNGNFTNIQTSTIPYTINNAQHRFMVGSAVIGYLNFDNVHRTIQYIGIGGSSLYYTVVDRMFNVKGGDGESRNYSVANPPGSINYPTDGGYLYALCLDTITQTYSILSYDNACSSGCVILAVFSFANTATQTSEVTSVHFCGIDYKINDNGGELVSSDNTLLHFANSVERVFFKTPYYRTSEDTAKFLYKGNVFTYDISSNHSITYPLVEQRERFMALCFDTTNNSIIWKNRNESRCYPIIAFVQFNSELTKIENVVSNVKYRVGFSEKVNKVLFGTLVNYGLNSSGLATERTDRASQNTALTLPQKAARLKFYFCDPDLVVGIRNGVTANNLSHNDYWFIDGSIFDIHDESIYYRLSFALTSSEGRWDYNDIDPDYVKSLFEYGDAVIEYITEDTDCINRNSDSEPYVKAAMMKRGLTDNILNSFPTFVHITDVHGDLYRMNNAIDYAKYLKADAILATGDIMAYDVSNGWDALQQGLLESTVPVCYCRGNHETYGNSDTSFNVFSTYYQSLTEQFLYKKDSSTAADTTYYYKDFAEKKIRIISLDPYERALIRGNYGCFSQHQINWFINTLLSTPNDYGIICILHSPEAYPNNQVSLEPVPNKGDFFADSNLTYWSTPIGINGTPLRDIIDAFISRTNISSSFTQTNDSSEVETITISADFSSIASSIEFIAWICGHQHIDLIGQYKNTINKQIVLNSVCTLSHYGDSSYPYMANLCDIPRGTLGKGQDAFNIYTIDRTNKKIKIARVGSNISETGEKRMFMELSYV